MSSVSALRARLTGFKYASPVRTPSPKKPHLDADTPPNDNREADHDAANGDVDSWHLCENGGNTNVVFRPAEGRAYDLASCKPIVLQLIY